MTIQRLSGAITGLATLFCAMLASALVYAVVHAWGE